MFRKNPPPWYDSSATCVICAVLMGGVCFFGAIGIRVAAVNPSYQWFLWVPVLLTVLSGGLVLSATVRFFRKRDGR